MPIFQSLNLFPRDIFGFSGSSPGKESTALQENLVQFLGEEDLLEKG